jgi:hypothetical protein
MFGSFFWQNSSAKNSIKVYEDNNNQFNNFDQYGNSTCSKSSSVQNSINNNINFQTSNFPYQVNNSNFVSTSALFECNYNYEYYQSKNPIFDSQKANTLANLGENNLKSNKQNPYVDQALIHTQIKTNIKQDNFEINSNISNSIKALMKQRRFSIRQRQVANQRERDRTHSVNSAFLLLRSMIPTDPIDRKLSKIETLRLAGSYISHLNAILNSPPEYANDKPCLNKLKYIL